MNFSTRPSVPLALSALCVALLPILSGCNQNASTPSPSAAVPAAPVSVAAPAQPVAAPQAPALTQDQLFQLVAPIALFPDQLVAQVLAGSTHPDQISAAASWLTGQSGATAQAVQDAANQQPWDPSVKGLTAFPNVLGQMAQNMQWTTALGTAYASDPQDVLNAIQALRQRAQTSGKLKSSAQIKVSSAPASSVTEGAYVVPPPQETIEIEPAQPNVVYVPQYDPRAVYGAPIPYYSGYNYQPAPVYENSGYSNGDLAAAGILAFGAGILIDQGLNHRHDWGWNSWGMNWGNRGNRGDSNFGRGNGGDRPAVIYNNNVYAPRAPAANNPNFNGGREARPGFNQPGEQPPIPQNGAGIVSRPGFSSNAANGGQPNFGAANRPSTGNIPQIQGNRPGIPNGGNFSPNNGAPHFSAQDARPSAPTQNLGQSRPGQPNTAAAAAVPNEGRRAESANPQFGAGNLSAGRPVAPQANAGQPNFGARPEGRQEPQSRPGAFSEPGAQIQAQPRPAAPESRSAQPQPSPQAPRVEVPQQRAEAPRAVEPAPQPPRAAESPRVEQQRPADQPRMEAPRAAEPQRVETPQPQRIEAPRPQAQPQQQRAETPRPQQQPQQQHAEAPRQEGGGQHGGGGGQHGDEHQR